jgi:A/G-specific adenine glycosylase
MVPRDPVALRRLPGVGPYTGAAVASIAYGRRVAALDTNARRIVARLDAGVEASGLAARDLAEAADAWVHPRRPGDWNQALMDLGREVCRPDPRCDRCPLAPWCHFRAAGHPARRSRAVARRQPAFEGSRRQARGVIVERLRRSATPVAALPATTGLDRRRVEDALATLEADGLIAIRRGRASLAR